MSALRVQLQFLLADRHSPEAKAFFAWLMPLVDRRVSSVGHKYTPDLLHPCEIEELVGEVMVQLVGGSLAQFRGETINELVAFVRTVSDRTVCRRVRRRLLERKALDEGGPDLLPGWMPPDPDAIGRRVPDSPLSEADTGYLVDLLRAGSKGELARRQGVSRAAVTQRVQRIQARIQSMAPRERAAAEAWLQEAARQVIDAG